MSNRCCVSYCTYLLCLRQYLWISEIHDLKIICIKNTGTWKQWHVPATVRMICRCELQFGKISPEFWRLLAFAASIQLHLRAPAGYLFHINQMQLCIFFLTYQTCMAILFKMFLKYQGLFQILAGKVSKVTGVMFSLCSLIPFIILTLSC